MGDIPYADPRSDARIAFTRALVCIKCGNIMIRRDRYTKIYRRKPGDPDFGLVLPE